ncbi:hypothetical protein NC652_038574 [Populus alba x Populus x berolinensis]|nr:hypothetical protein NC652_038574 [Populus alba x Populus x berolinensis]
MALSTNTPCCRTMFNGLSGQYHCGGGVDKAFGPDIVDAHFKACLLAGINISGINGEVMPGQELCFHLIPSIFRPIFISIYPFTIQFECYNTKSMRNKGGYEVIKKAIEKPGLRHAGQIAASVEGNGQRLADRHETSDIKTFKWVRGKGNNFLATQVLLL